MSEAIAEPIIQAAIAALTPEAEQLLKAAEAHLVAEAEHLKAEIDNSHNSVLTWLRNTLTGDSRVTGNPMPAVPAPQTTQS